MKFIDLSLVVEKIKEKVSLYDIMKFYEVDLLYGDTSQKICCPFPPHDDKIPSAKYYKENENLHCFVCNYDLDVIGFVAKKEEISFIQAIDFILKKYDIDVSYLQFRGETSDLDKVFDRIKNKGFLLRKDSSPDLDKTLETQYKMAVDILNVEVEAAIKEGVLESDIEDRIGNVLKNVDSGFLKVKDINSAISLVSYLRQLKNDIDIFKRDMENSGEINAEE